MIIVQVTEQIALFVHLFSIYFFSIYFYYLCILVHLSIFHFVQFQLLVIGAFVNWKQQIYLPKFKMLPI